MIFGCKPVSVRLVYELSTGVVLSETSLLLVSMSLRQLLVCDSLDNDENLDAVLGLSLEQIVQPVTLISRSAEVQLGRDPVRELL